MLAIGIFYIPVFARLARASALSVKELDYIAAARVAGQGEAAIVRRHVLPNILSPLVVQATVQFAVAILAEAGLSYLGLGTQPPHPSWGRMLNEAQTFMELAPWMALFPGLAIAWAVLGFQFAGRRVAGYPGPQVEIILTVKVGLMISEASVKKVLARIDPREVIDLTASLVRCNSVWNPQAGTSERPAAELAARWARQHGFDVTVEEVSPGRPNVIVRWEAGPGSRTLMFEGHTDVVTAGDHDRWQYDPFGAQIENGRMFGRGTNDTKGNLAAMLVAMAALKAAGIPLAGAVVGGVLCDEEGMMTGVQHFIDRGHADAVTAAVICEPQDGLICIAQKGAVRARFVVNGRMSHGAMPLSGLNPAPAVARIIDGLAALESDAIERPGKDPLLGWPSFTPTVVQAPAQGPPQLNVMPGEAEILVDVRTTPDQHHDAIRSALSELAERTAA